MDQGRERGGERVMCRHHEETHVIGDFLRGHERAVLMRRAAEMREQVLAAALAPERHLTAEIVDDERAAQDAAAHRRSRQRPADDGGGGGHHVDEGALDRRHLGTERRAQERRRREVKRQLLDRGIKQELRRAQPPRRQPLGDPGIERGEIGFERTRFEGDRERAAMEAMLVEIEQHEAAREEQPQIVPPPLGRGEQLRLVGENEAERLGPQAARPSADRRRGCDRRARIASPFA